MAISLMKTLKLQKKKWELRVGDSVKGIFPEPFSSHLVMSKAREETVSESVTQGFFFPAIIHILFGHLRPDGGANA